MSHFVFMVPMSLFHTKFYRETFKDIHVHIQILSPPPRFTKRWLDKATGKFKIKKDVVVGPCAWMYGMFNNIDSNIFTVVGTNYKKGVI
jgi:hypothetical protein